MDEDEAALLAELRAISSKSASASRFDDGNNDDGGGVPPASSPKGGQRSAAGGASAAGGGGGSPALQQQQKLEINTRTGDEQQQEPKTPTTAKSAGSPSPIGSGGKPLPPWKRFRMNRMSRTPKSGAGEASPAANAASSSPALDVATGSGGKKSIPPASPQQQQQVGVGRHRQSPAREEEIMALQKSPAAGAGGAGAGGSALEIDSSGFPATASSFKGERGGAAEDSELLALLRGVSASSTSASRFADDGGGGGSDDDGADINTALSLASGVSGRGMTATSSSPPAKPALGSSPRGRDGQQQLPPWKRGGRRGGGGAGAASRKSGCDGAASFDVDIVVAAPKAAAVAKKSADAAQQDLDAAAAAEPTADEAQRQQHASTSVVPQYGVKSEISSTFVGERGGAAEDAELLALLRGVSAKSSSAARFDDSDGNNNPGGGGAAVMSDSKQEPPRPSTEATPEAAASPAASDPEPKPSSPPQSRRGGDELPPWKRRGAASGRAKQQQTVDVLVVAAPPAPSSNGATTAASKDDGIADIDTDDPHPDAFDVSEPASRTSEKQAATAPPTSSFGMKSDLPSSTFTGERGGSAEDAELLALLRGVSAKSSGANRFSDDDHDCGGVGEAPSFDESKNQGSTAEPASRSPVAHPARSGVGRRGGDGGDGGQLPPWKRRDGKQKSRKDDAIDVVVAAPPVAASRDDGGGRKDVPPPSESTEHAEHSYGKPSQPIKPDLPSSFSGDQSGRDSSQQTPADLPTYGIKSDIPSTFSGDRGGSAEDAELLALLRGVSSGANRFSDDDKPAKSQDALPKVPSPCRDSSNNQASGIAASSPQLPTSRPDPFHTASPPGLSRPSVPAAPAVEEESLSKDDLPAALTDKSFKIRGKAYDLLSDMLRGIVGGREKIWNIDANQILPGLDDLVPAMMEDANVAALDKALNFGMLYAEHCTGAGYAQQAGEITSSLLKKNGFTARPTTVRQSSALVLNLMEAGTDGTSSIHSVVEVLLNEGLASRKPKVAAAAVSLILSAAIEFGAAALPLAVITSCSPKILSHTNASVRSAGVQILAEICRAVGSMKPIQDVLDNTKRAQVTELEKLLSEQPNANTPSRQLRSQQNFSSSSIAACSSDDAAAALEAGAKELEAQRYAARPAIDLMHVLAKTDYASRIELAKWKEKVDALTIVIECGGEKPYKLAQPSHSVNYMPLISEMRKLLGHTHFAVCNKSMEVLSMLAEGVGEKLYPYLRPLLPQLMKLFKDKKLTRSVGSCLDSFFGNVIGFGHLLEQDDALPSTLDEHNEKNALTRSSALEFLGRCIQRNNSAGPRGSLSAKEAARIATLCLSKLEDSHASVRSAAMNGLKLLQQFSDGEVRKAASSTIESLKQENPRAYKALTNDNQVAAQKDIPKSSLSGAAKKEKVPSSDRAKPQAVGGQKASELEKKKSRPNSNSGPSSRDDMKPCSDSNQEPLSLDAALSCCGLLHIPQWDAPEDDGGILAGLKSSKWMLRQDAIKSITAFLESGGLTDSKDLVTNCCSLLIVVGEHTRAFKETNVNIMKAIIALFAALCDLHEGFEKPIGSWVMKSGVDASVSKIADKKLSSGCKSLLTKICVVHHPHHVLLEGFKILKKAKSPLAHEEFLVWIGKSFCSEFGAASVGSGLTDIIPSLLEEVSASNVKVKRAALGTIGTLHRQIGLSFKALTLSLAQPSVKDDLDKCFNDNLFDDSLQTTAWPRQYLAALNSASNGSKTSSGLGVSLAIPKSDLTAELEDDCIAKLGSKDGKASWKIRKQALDDVDAALKRCNGLLDMSGHRIKHIYSLMRALRDRLTDTQINLKPLAASVVGAVLSNVDTTTQAQLGKLVFAPLINAAMNDIKKPMRDASLSALQAGTMVSSLDGGGINPEALEEFVAALVSEVNERSSRAGGLPDVLLFLHGGLDSLHNLEKTSTGEKYSGVLIECLTSSKSETRAAASMLLNDSFKKGVISIGSIRKAAARLKPAKQRQLGPQIAALEKMAATEKNEKENDEPASEADAPTTRRQHIPTAPQGVPSSSPRRPMNAGTKNSREPHQKVASPETGDDRHPLEARVGNHAGHGAFRSIVWPEYPEEPQGATLLAELKKCWSPLLPPVTLNKLFPSSGIKKQDDASEGCELLSRALEIDSSTGGEAVENQLDFIFKWLVYVLCSKETTVGLQSLLSVTTDLLSFVLERNRQLTDGEALVLIPFLLDKASIAKGRFRDSFLELVSMTQNENLLPVKTLGSTVCVAVMERTSHAKARVLCYHTAINCLENGGLAALGKKGVVVAARLLSEETIPENRAAALDLLEVVLSKMNGDMQRLARICGPNLEDKARQLLEERCAKKDTPVHPKAHTSIPESPRDKLPSFSLREGPRETSSRYAAATSPPAAAGGHLQVAAGNEPSSSVAHGNATTGGAADLRARLMKIREKSTAYGSVAEEALLHESLDGATGVSPSRDVETVFNTGLAYLNEIVLVDALLSEEDSRLLECIDVLKRFHAALSKQQSPSAGLSVEDLVNLRDVVADHLNDTMESLSRLIRFALDYGEPSINAGMSIPLLSVCLATLMALFRDTELSPSVSSDALAFLIQETATALLDPRLASTSDLDEATRSQMVRAINKLAVQAATGASRHVAFQSLLTLQQQLSLDGYSTEDVDVSNQRLSRVLTKLFARVIKAEEAMPEPYSADTVDMETILCMMEDSLEGGPQDHFAIMACSDMVQDLVKSILQSCGSSVILTMMQDLGIDFPMLTSVITDLGDVVNEAAIVEGLQPSFEESAASGSNKHEEAAIAADQTMPSPPKPPQSSDLTFLVSNVGNAPEGPEREAALEALRQYTTTNGDDELADYLKQLSIPFREFIEDQLREMGTAETPNTSEVVRPTANSMTERLRSLRTRLEATEKVVQTAVEGKPTASDVAPSAAVPAIATTSTVVGETSLRNSPPSKIPATPKRSSRLTQPTPSKLVPPSQSKLQQPSSLRDRMAASQESRKVSSALGAGGAGGAGASSSSVDVSTSMGRAAALRARLEAVKQKNKQAS